MRSLLAFLFLFNCFFSFGKKDSIPFIFNEFGFSLNRTHMADENTADRYGFGLSVSRIGMKEKHFNFIFGIEYNLTRQYKKSMYEGRFVRTSNVEYTLSYLTIPFVFRYNIGKKVRFFIDAGTYLDFGIGGSRTGTKHTYFPDQNNNMVYNEFSFRERGFMPFNYGVSGGLGLRLPVKNKELFVKCSYQFGLRNLSGAAIDGIYNRYIRVSLGLII